jgi:hypothetical protein
VTQTDFDFEPKMPRKLIRPATLANPRFIKAFWMKVNKTTSCWLWMGSIEDGYGTARCDGKTQRTHRICWQIVNGSIPNGLQVLHHCDVRNCVNPNHLFLGTNYDNVQDKMQKGRHLTGSQAAQYSNPKRGEENWHSKFTDEQVLDMRWQYSHGAKICDIAEDWDQLPHVVNMIVHGKRWAHLPGALPTHRISHFAEKVREMKASGVTQHEIAIRLGFSDAAISRAAHVIEKRIRTGSHAYEYRLVK